MTANEKAIDLLRFHKKLLESGEFIGGDKLPYVEYEIAIEALKKQEPKKMLVGEINGHLLGGFHCPNCKEWYAGKLYFEYCPICGQRLDWEEQEESE